jgi:hypothetical protein
MTKIVDNNNFKGFILDHSRRHQGEIKRNTIRYHGGEVSLVVGKDLQLSQISKMEGKTLVGKFCGCRVSMKYLN